MKYRSLLASTAVALAIGFMSEVEEVVTVKGVRVSKSVYDADQALPSGERQYGAVDAKAETEQSFSGQQMSDGSTPPLAAPSAPHFGNSEAAQDAAAGASTAGATSLQRDPLKDAVAQSSAAPNQRIVMKKGSGKTPYKVVDGSGNAVELAGIETAGYETEDLAWKAIKDLPH